MTGGAYLSDADKLQKGKGESFHTQRRHKSEQCVHTTNSSLALPFQYRTESTTAYPGNSTWTVLCRQTRSYLMGLFATFLTGAKAEAALKVNNRAITDRIEGAMVDVCTLLQERSNEVVRAGRRLGLDIESRHPSRRSRQ